MSNNNTSVSPSAAPAAPEAPAAQPRKKWLLRLTGLVVVLGAAYGIYAPERFNLHSLWDGWLAERAISTPPSLVRVYSADERAIMQPGTVEDWSRQSWEIARDVTYATALGGDPCGPVPARAMLSDETIAKLVEPVRLNIMRGGLRLARLLNESLSR